MSAPAATRDPADVRVDELLQEVRDMVSGRTRCLPDLRHMSAVLVKLDEAEAREKDALLGARVLLDGMNDERESLVTDLRDLAPLGFIEKLPERDFDFRKKKYLLIRTFVAAFEKRDDCEKAFREVREQRIAARVNGEPPYPRPMGAAGEKNNGIR